MDHLATCPLCRDVKAGIEHNHDRIISVNEHSIFLVGEHQFFKGYSMLVARSHVREMHELPQAVQQAIFADLMRLGCAVADVYQPLKINYASLGNVVEHLHWHVIPRYSDEVDPKAHPWAEANEFQNFKTTPEAAKLVSAALKKAPSF